MAEYIEREKVLAEYDRQHKGPPGGARKIIETFPAADVRPVVRGRWVTRPYMMGNTQYCSRCGENYGEKYHFCPNCGADMRGGEAGE
jgi:NADH pyrophosphatase NudC (nudix superfamily)